MSILNILDRVPPRWDGREIEWEDWETAPIATAQHRTAQAAGCMCRSKVDWR
ncbi:hypothetical protein [Corynebacterium diphtheriae]|uniref:hypothetical protein n=1 Tax=Corynebacterium diphtheriae TaxID=1717 RepID=UPI0016012D7C|nr:hypothetical protein [Corynebacterium diphtheriae]